MLDDCIRIMLELGKGCLVAKADIKDAVRIIPIFPLAYRLLGFKFKGQFYFDMCLPMGCSTSCQSHFHKQCTRYVYIKQRFCTSATFLMTLSFSERPFHVASYIWTGFLICRMTNILIKHSKTVLPTSKVVLHGIEADSVEQTIKLPRDKLSALCTKLIAMSKRKKASLREVQSLVRSSFHPESFCLAEYFVVAS